MRANFALTGVRSVPFPCFLLSRPLLSLVVSASLSYRGFMGLFGSLCDLNYWIGPVDKNQRISRTGNSTLLWIFKDIRIMTKSRV